MPRGSGSWSRRDKVQRNASKRVTIEDVASQAGVSIKTVSRVLNREPNVRPATRRKVEAVVRDLAYTPHISARRMGAKRSFIVGLLYRDDDVNHFIPDIQHGVLDVCRERGYNLMLHPCAGTVEDAAEEVQDLVRQALIDGFILTPPLADSRTLIGQMQQLGIPFVRVSQLYRGEYSPSVSVGDYAGAYAMTEYLARLGHRDIGFIIGNENQGASIDRLCGFRDAVRDFHLHAEESWIRRGDFTFESGAACATEIISLEKRPTAIFASNDDMAAGAQIVAHRHGYLIPGDISIVGYDDIATSQRLWPPLTTVRQPTKQTAASATGMLLDCLATGDLTPVNRELPAELVVRESAGPAPSGAGVRR